MMTLHTFTCRFCGESFTEECPELGGKILEPPCCAGCENGAGRGSVGAADAVGGKGLEGTANPERAKGPGSGQRTTNSSVLELGASWPERHVAGLAEYDGPALAKAKELWNSHVAQRPCTLVLHGPRGRGKTGMATWWAWMRGQGGRTPGLYVTAYELFSRIRRSWHPSSEIAEWDALKPYQRVAYLVIDQLHQCRALSANGDKAALWERMALAELLDYRYRAGKTTILIATVDTMEELRQAIDADILDRVKEAGGVVRCEWESYRG